MNAVGKKWRRHQELIFALISGICIVVAWLMTKMGFQTEAIFGFILAYVIGGYAKAKEGVKSTIEEKDLNVEMLMIFAAIGAAAIGYWAEGAMLIFIFAVSGALETYTLEKSQKEISALLDLQPEEALRISSGREEYVPVKNLQIGDIIFIKPGERVPTDGEVYCGETTIDEAAITGEAIPTGKKIGDEVFGGTMNIRSAIEVSVTKQSDQTLFQKIIRLVQNAQSEKSPSQLFIERFEGTYVKAVIAFVLLMMFIPHFLFNWSWSETFYRAMILLVVASPCALVASITPATLAAISNGARRGILCKGGVHLERLASVKVIAFDKTGTLTEGKPEVTDVYVRQDIVKEELLRIVSSIESYSTHPLAEAIMTYAKDVYRITLTKPEQVEEIAGFGLKGTFEQKEYIIGKEEFMGAAGEVFCDGISQKLKQEGKTVVYVKDDKGILGLLALKDTLRTESLVAMKELQHLGVEVVMITGDNEQTAQAIAKESNIKEYYASCLPEEKVAVVKKLKEKYGVVAMVGDGINDAPALATANIGIAMGEGTDVALETADIVLMKNNLSLLGEAIILSKRMNQIVKQNIIFSLAVIAVLIISDFLQLLILPLGVIGHEGSTILVILNGLRLLKGNKKARRETVALPREEKVKGLQA